MSRWISGIILAIIAIALLAKAPADILRYVVMGLAVVAVWEFLTISQASHVVIKIVAALLVPAGLYIFFESSYKNIFLLYFFVLIFCGFVLHFAFCKDQAKRVQGVAFFIFAEIYCVVLFGILGLLTTLPDFRYWLFYVLACTVAGDTGAYLAGRAFGKHKLAPSISPGKTIEGVVGGLALAGLAGYVVSWYFLNQFNPLLVIGLGMGLSAVGVIGDLSESLLKRGFGVKDSGSIIPGHGGILDRLDALLFTAPVVYGVAVWFT